MQIFPFPLILISTAGKTEGEDQHLHDGWRSTHGQEKEGDTSFTQLKRNRGLLQKVLESIFPLKDVFPNLTEKKK